jgi:hypothetical protein
MKFLKIIDNYKKTKLVLEQDAPPMDPNAAAMPAAPANPVPPTPAQDEPQKVDVPASVVRLARLLKQALIIKMSDDDIDFVSNLPEINENNAIEMVQQMTPIMKKYSNVETDEGQLGQE